MTVLNEEQVRKMRAECDGLSVAVAWDFQALAASHETLRQQLREAEMFLRQWALDHGYDSAGVESIVGYVFGDGLAPS